ncbi:MAG TPA: hypothetical protein VJ551_03910 [Nitrososphaeraceae archaeon]|nr:hypothetical protein [Nitrososphaeraceae archaeon]
MPPGKDHVDSKKRTMPVCFSQEDLNLLEKYAKKKRMINYSQAIENIATQNIVINTLPAIATRLCFG